MAKWTVETHEKEKPILLVAGAGPGVKGLIQEFLSDFKIALISDSLDINQQAAEKENANIYRINTDAAYLIKNLEEKIDYAVIFLNEERQRNYIPPVVEKLTADQTKTVVILNVDNIHDFYDIILTYRKSPKINFLFLGDVYSENDLVQNRSDIDDLIISTFQKKSVTLTVDDLTPIFPIWQKDALVGINHILFGPQKKEKFYKLFYSYPETLVSAVHILKRVEPDLEIKYREKKDVRKRLTQSEFSQNLKEKLVAEPVPLDKYYEGFEKSLENFTEGKMQIGQVKKQESGGTPASKKGGLLLRAFAYAFLLYLIFSGIAGALGVQKLRAAIAALKEQDYKASEVNIKQSAIFLESVLPNVTLTSRALATFGVKNDLIASFETSSSLLAQAAQSLTSVEKINKGIDRSELEDIASDVSYLYFTAAKLRSETRLEILDSILTPELAQTVSFLPVLDKILGFDHEKKYLLLFQNNAELRPTGGFIGSVGELTVTSGKLVDLAIQDVYEYDGKLTAHIEPHYIIRRFLQPHLYLRDSNFNLNYQESASHAANLYFLETGRQVDGVIAVNYEAVRQIIKELGPVKLTAHNKTIDEKNAFDFLQSTIDDNFFPGSTAKKDVLNALYNALVLKMEDDSGSFVRVAGLLPKFASEKNILFAFSEKSTQAIFSAYGYSGEYQDKRVKDSEMIPDALSINEANIGVNKANVHTRRQTTYEVDLSGSSISSKLTHALTNDSENDYHAYVRIFVPDGSTLKSIKIDDKKQTLVQAIIDFPVYEKRNFKAPAGLEVDNFKESFGQTFGIRVLVPKGAKQEITIEFENGVKKNSGPIINYSLLFIKQPGILEHPFTLLLKYPDDYSPQEVEGAKLDQGRIEIEKNVQQDGLFNVKLIKG